MALTPDTEDLSVSALFGFSDYVCLVTGGATGLGKLTHSVISMHLGYISMGSLI